jgi:hypothetical protein
VKRSILASAAFVSLLTFPLSGAAAEPDAIAIFVQGESAKEIGDAIEAALPPDWRAVDRARFAAAMTNEGQRTPIATAMAKPKSRAELVAHAKDAAFATQARSIVIAHSAKTGTKRSVSILVVDPAKEAAPAPVRLTSTKSGPDKKELSTTLASMLPAHAHGAGEAAPSPPPTSAAPAPLPEKRPTNETSAPPPPSDEARADAPVRLGDRVAYSGDLLDLAAGVTFRSRHFSYNDGRSANLRPYDVDGVPSIGAALEVHPFGRDVSSPLAGLGIAGDFQTAVALDSRAPSGAEVSTSWTRFDAGLRYRLRYRGVEGGVIAQYGQEAFGFSGSSIVRELPEVRYGFGRGGLDVRVPLGPIAVRAEAAYLLVLSAGGVGGRFRSTSANGVEGALGASLPLTRILEARAYATYARYFYAFSPEVGDPNVAGGALDEMMGGRVALALRLD